MLIVNVKEAGSIEKALKKFKNKYRKTKVMNELRERKEYTKPSTKRREELKKAKYINQIRLQQETDEEIG